MEDALVGSIFPWAGDYAPQNFVFCNGQLLSIAENQMLYSLITTIYGGDGVTTFAVPNLNGRTPIGSNNSSTVLGKSKGATTVTLSAANLPPHAHAINAVSDAGKTAVPTGNLLANTGTDKDYNTNLGTPKTMAANAVGTTGKANPIPFSVVQPYCAVNFIICVTGYYPTRN